MARINVVVSFLAALAVVQAAQLLNLDGQKDAVPGSYVVVMNDGLSGLDFESHVKSMAKVQKANALKRDFDNTADGVKFKYNINGWQAYSGKFDNKTIQSILDDPRVNYIEPQRTFRAFGWVTQDNAPSWGLGRISHTSRGRMDYVYDSSAGENVTVYSVDSGVDISHPEFEGRAIWGVNAADNSDVDQIGHGTHTSGTIAGKTYGVAKMAKIVAVKVLDAGGQGTNGGIIQGINWAVNHARQNNVTGKAVMNMSFGGGLSRAINEAASSAVRAGIFMVAAAGNNNEDARYTTPASARGVCAVGASTQNDLKARFSNWGPTLAVYAPGDRIWSAMPDGGRDVMRGTSMAAPHVAGVAAVLISSEKIGTDRLCERIKELSVSSIQSPGADTTDKLLYNGSGQ
ncbi:hypothetical protein D8B26_001470 [Coccidioides posadasii str. Silveira]|uniref:Subtilisin-like protease CPC735_047380 n=3 Tax=Coccidioides posadasii TaxID=199306 RepID=SU11B_COCP7|nr:subtilisin-like protease, putative [Coccidioides posadasii C735 delta SOWgp]C5PFR5.1 RecName: Full=Subtilisin-like protease CPC735_047380; Flags: Precursor [Coccidioides posadasii C735 delta SOWgp]EFW13408.1 extracellular serine protease [Coccidioides posadasii str. Silveira]KMM64714.1 alkaline proteinase [Coccidioides posadasii RMSCC 3488]EER23368.1 subtilisin-like protease, putative [Coccidioides posadasii C735 delta SOWgp]QVM06764.1 hypothetical protein D8B26_001470 [Coccidioides posadas|eukprot:XP_003065513.1 subtilisin-like protease, putative [Coccidioides posadasii C735 delta SOWgp]